MLKKLNKKGFTLAELLIVVAIIGVLVAISIPIFTAQLKKARLATNQANARAAYAAAVAEELNKDSSGALTTYTYNVGTTEITTGGTAGTIVAPISTWTKDDYGDKVYNTWYVTLEEGEQPKFGHES